MTSKFTELVIDCRDPAVLADFWKSVLDYRVDVNPRDRSGGEVERIIELRARLFPERHLTRRSSSLYSVATPLQRRRGPEHPTRRNFLMMATYLQSEGSVSRRARAAFDRALISLSSLVLIT
jgi:hypothetical protein